MEEASAPRLTVMEARFGLELALFPGTAVRFLGAGLMAIGRTAVAVPGVAPWAVDRPLLGLTG